jgi:hypothetical protein
MLPPFPLREGQSVGAERITSFILGLIFFAIVVAALNFLAQRVYPTKISDPTARRFLYRLLVRGLLLALIAAAYLYFTYVAPHQPRTDGFAHPSDRQAVHRTGDDVNT